MDTLESLRRKIAGAVDLESVVRTMKAIAASNIGQYEMASNALGDYYRSVTLGIFAYFRQSPEMPEVEEPLDKKKKCIRGALVFGSDQGLVGQFNDSLSDYVIQAFAGQLSNSRVFAVGERILGRLTDAGMDIKDPFNVPNSVSAITSLVSHVLARIEVLWQQGTINEFWIFHNRLKSGSGYEPSAQRLLPLDRRWRRDLGITGWPTDKLPEVVGGSAPVLSSLIREYLFVSIYRACAESLASENASRLEAMQRAEKNIDELLEELNSTYHRLRQSSIDEELFDVVSGFEALKK